MIAPSFYVMTMPGLETLAFSEIRARVPDAELIKFARGIALFRTMAKPATLLELRTVEDVFVTLAHVTGLGHGRDALRVIHSATLNADVVGALAVWRQVRHAVPPPGGREGIETRSASFAEGPYGPSGGQPHTWRVISQKAGTHDFRRVDAGNAVSDALRRTLPRGMSHVADDADVEFWLWLSGSEALVGLRLSDATMRHRGYKREHVPASLRPTVAAAMGWLARPTQEDIVLDPLCGAGTLIIERALLGPLAQAIGGDMRKEAVTIARRNALAAGVRAEWHVWDARALPLEAASVTRIITNLPFGKQIGTEETNADLYAALVGEFGRVLGAGGVLVTLTSADRLWDRILRQHGWRIVKKVVLVVLGQPASMFVAERA
jgi:tRNA (guanine6-N2)-methyltransferase